MIFGCISKIFNIPRFDFSLLFSRDRFQSFFTFSPFHLFSLSPDFPNLPDFPGFPLSPTKNAQFYKFNKIQSYLTFSCRYFKSLFSKYIVVLQKGKTHPFFSPITYLYTSFQPIIQTVLLRSHRYTFCLHCSDIYTFR